MLPTLVREKNRFPWFGTRSDFDRLFDEFITGVNGGLGLIEPRTVGPMVFMPPIDMKETDTGLMVEVEVPGFKSGDDQCFAGVGCKQDDVDRCRTAILSHALADSDPIHLRHRNLKDRKFGRVVAL